VNIEAWSGIKDSLREEQSICRYDDEIGLLAGGEIPQMRRCVDWDIILLGKEMHGRLAEFFTASSTTRRLCIDGDNIVIIYQCLQSWGGEVWRPHKYNIFFHMVSIDVVCKIDRDYYHA